MRVSPETDPHLCFITHQPSTLILLPPKQGDRGGSLSSPIASSRDTKTHSELSVSAVLSLSLSI